MCLPSCQNYAHNCVGDFHSACGKKNKLKQQIKVANYYIESDISIHACMYAQCSIYDMYVYILSYSYENILEYFIQLKYLKIHIFFCYSFSLYADAYMHVNSVALEC